MQFQGFWISGDSKEVAIVPAVFDETELSEASDWKQAHQNVDPELPHGFVEWEHALVDVDSRLAGHIASALLQSDRNDR